MMFDVSELVYYIQDVYKFTTKLRPGTPNTALTVN